MQVVCYNVQRNEMPAMLLNVEWNHRFFVCFFNQGNYVNVTKFISLNRFNIIKNKIQHKLFENFYFYYLIVAIPEAFINILIYLFDRIPVQKRSLQKLYTIV